MYDVIPQVFMYKPSNWNVRTEKKNSIFLDFRIFEMKCQYQKDETSIVLNLKLQIQNRLSTKNPLAVSASEVGLYSLNSAFDTWQLWRFNWRICVRLQIWVICRPPKAEKGGKREWTLKAHEWPWIGRRPTQPSVFPFDDTQCKNL